MGDFKRSTFEADWIKDTGTALKQHIIHPGEPLMITKEIITNSCKNKRNWSSPGKDKIASTIG